MSKFPVSVIVPTYNGAHKILNLLKSLEQQTITDFELIIVIDGSRDNTFDVLHTLNTPLELIIINQPNGGRAKARNAGLSKATGELLIFFDDDMRPFPDCIAHHVRHHAIYPACACVGLAVDDEELIISDFQRFKSAITIKWNTHLPKDGIPMGKDNLLLAAANFSIPSKIFKHLGGFDERLTDIEDFELATRIFAKGIPVYFNSLAKAYHDDPITCRSYIHRQREYAKAHHTLHQLRPEIVGRFKNAEVYKPSVFKKIVFNIFSNKFFVSTIDQLNFYPFILPQKIRYKLYDVVVWGMAKVYPERRL